MLQVFFIVVGGSIGIFFLMWVIVYALHLARHDHPLPVNKDSRMIRRIRMKAGQPTAVWFSDIRSLERERVLAGELETDYSYTEGYSSGCPDAWSDDLYRRRN